MALVAVSSPKGGVGKTTLVANLGVALAGLGWQVSLVDFDVQNALRLHFDLPIDDPAGYAGHAAETDWAVAARPVAPGLRLVPYGQVEQRQRLRLDGLLAEGGAKFLGPRLGAMLTGPRAMVIADTAPGPTPALAALEDLADLRIAVLLSDATSLALLPQAVAAGRFFHRPSSAERPLQLILNQINVKRRLSRDIAAFVHQRAEGVLLGTVRQDEALAEAVAQQDSIFGYAPHSGAAQDIMAIARRVDQSLGGRAAAVRVPHGVAG